MARKRVAKGQQEIEEFKSPDRIDELHVLGLEIKDLEQQRMEITRREKEKRQMAVAQLDAHKITEYDSDGVHVWKESKGDKLKVKLDGGPEDEE